MKKIPILLLFGIGTIIIAGVIYAWRSSIHYNSFNLGEHFQVDLKAEECLSCFRDWQINYDIEIKNTTTNRLYQFDFWTGKGPYIQFKLSKENPEIVLIEGYGPEAGNDHLINLNTNSIEEHSHEIDKNDFYKVVQINDQFQVTE